jgi:hypothetical protein
MNSKFNVFLLLLFSCIVSSELFGTGMLETISLRDQVTTPTGPTVINSSLFNSSTTPKLKVFLGETIFISDFNEFQLNGNNYFCVASFGYVNGTNVYVLNENGTYLYGAKFDVNVVNIDFMNDYKYILLAGSDDYANEFIYVTDFGLKLLFSYSAQNKMLPLVYFDEETRLVYTHGQFSIDVLHENFTKFDSIELSFCNGYKFLTSFNESFYLSCLLSYSDTGSIVVLDRKTKKLINTFGSNLCNLATSNKTFVSTRFSVDSIGNTAFTCMYDDYSFFNMNLIDSTGKRMGEPIHTESLNSGVLLDSKGRLVVGSRDGLWFYY